MRVRNQLCPMIGCLLSMIAVPALAVSSAPVGWYMEGNVGSSYAYNKSYPGNPSRSGIGGNGNVGYKFMPYLGAEVGYTIYANTNIRVPATGTTAAFDRHYSYDVALKGILPIKTTGFELFAKLGVDQIKSSVGIDNPTAARSLGISGNSHTANGLYTAAGLQYYFVPVMAANIQWALAQGNSSTGNATLTSAGLSFLFA